MPAGSGGAARAARAGRHSPARPDGGRRADRPPPRRGRPPLRRDLHHGERPRSPGGHRQGDLRDPQPADRPRRRAPPAPADRRCWPRCGPVADDSASGRRASACPSGRRSAPCACKWPTSTGRSTTTAACWDSRVRSQEPERAALVAQGGDRCVHRASGTPGRDRCRAAACSGSITSPSCCPTGPRSALRLAPRDPGIHAGSADHAVSEAITLPIRTGSASRSMPIGRGRPGGSTPRVELFMTTAPLDVRGVICRRPAAPPGPACRQGRRLATSTCTSATCRRRGLLPPRARLRQSRLELPRSAVPVGGRLPPSPRRQHLVGRTACR